MTTPMPRISRTGSFVRIDMPPPGRVVLALRPSVAKELAGRLNCWTRYGARTTSEGEVDQFDGISVKVVHTVVPGKPPFVVRFGGWQGRLDLDRDGLLRLCSDLTKASFGEKP